jgi:hypothetical protein
MRILFDQGTPAPLRHELVAQTVSTAYEMQPVSHGDRKSTALTIKASPIAIVAKKSCALINYSNDQLLDSSTNPARIIRRGLSSSGLT